MAWLSVGTSNNDLIQKMIENGVFEEGPILEAFRVTDRGDFVSPEDRVQAYSDRPLKRGFIHLSAPHMYVTVLKALDLKSGKSFLNIGSGSGYLSCLAAFLLGEEGVSHGVEISESACLFSREKAKVWHAKLMSKLKEDEESLGTPVRPVISPDGIAFVTSNCFDIDILSAVSTMKYDRIYVGAGCPESRKEFFLSMLADDGIMVAPINEKNQMIVIRKFCGRVYNSKPISQVNFAPLLDTTVRADEPALLAELASMESNASLNSDIQQTIQKVQAASASSSFIFHPLPFTGGGHLHHHGSGSNGSSPSSAVPSPGAAGSVIHGNNNSNSSNNRLLTEETVVRVRLPALVWAPLRRRHLQFPPDFRRAVFTILLANNQAHQYTSSYMQYIHHHDHPQQQQQQQVQHNHHRAGPVDRAWACLPHHIWLFIFTFASRDWFCVPKSEVQALSTELAVERRLRRSAEDKLRKAETARRTAEQERDMYRIALARLKQRSKHLATAGNNHNSTSISSTSLGAALWAHGSFSDIEFDEADEEEEEEEDEEDEDLMEEEDEEEEEEEWNEEMENDVVEGEEVEDGEEDEEEEGSVTITGGSSNSSSSSDSEEGEAEQEEGEEVHDVDGEMEGDVVDANVIVVTATAAGVSAPPAELNDLEPEEESSRSSGQSNSASFQSVPEEPVIPHSDTAMEEATSPATPSGDSFTTSFPNSISTSISTASMPTSSTYDITGGGALAWQRASSSTAPPAFAFAAPIAAASPSQGVYFHHNYFSRYNDTQYQYQQLHHLQQGGAAAVAGSLSSDATCTTVESALSNNSHSHIHLGMTAPAPAAAVGATTTHLTMPGGTIMGANNGNNTSRASALSFSAEERISDCTDASSSSPHNNNNGEDEDGEEDSSEQFTTDELL